MTTDTARFATPVLGRAVEIAAEEAGSGSPLLLLHGGAGVATMRPLLSQTAPHRRILPTHPGFDGTARPAWLASVRELALLYLAMIDTLGLERVALVGNSVGGWIAAEMASRKPAAIAALIVIDAVGLEPTTETGPIADPASLPMSDLLRLSFADPRRIPPASPEARERRVADQQALMAYAGDPFMHDPSLAERLADIAVPTLILWGDSDGIVQPAYGQALARAVPGATFEIVKDAGHLPQLEQTQVVAASIHEFVRRTVG